jgi:crotonobetainyl-CoA:carnitine CoA-transferase CaiB-like acyl-CoA transferase
MTGAPTGSSFQPLRDVAVVELASEYGLGARLLAELGADVILVEPTRKDRRGGPAGQAGRREIDVSFAVRNAGKRSVRLDPDDQGDAELLFNLAGQADVVIDTSGPDDLARNRIRDAYAERPPLVVVSVTPFGLTGPWRDRAATWPTLLALSGLLDRCIVDGRVALLPPTPIPSDVAATMIAYTSLLALEQRAHTGRGDYLDLSVFEAMCQAADAGLAKDSDPMARVDLRKNAFPAYRCADGYVRLVLLEDRHWVAMRGWLGDPPELLGDEFASYAGRRANAQLIDAHLERLFAPRAAIALAAEGQRRGVPLAPVLTPAHLLDSPDLSGSALFTDAEFGADRALRVPAGYLNVDGARTGGRLSALSPGQHTSAVTAAVSAGRSPFRATRTAKPPYQGAVSPPLAGLRVLEFGQMIAGPEVGKFLAEAGADVIRVEAPPVPGRVRRPEEIRPRDITLNRNKRSIGIDVKSDAGRELVLRLVSSADVLVENMAPGAMDRLGLDAETLRARRPELVVIHSQLFSPGTEWDVWRGYGVLARGVGGLSALWRWPDDPTAFADGHLLYPDNFIGRLGAYAALAGLRQARETGRGVEVFISQAEAVLNMLADLFAAEQLAPGSVLPAGNRNPAAAPWGVYPCEGQGETCVVTVRDDKDWDSLRPVLGSWADDERWLTTSGRTASAGELDELLAAWTRERPAAVVADLLQSAGVPAGRVDTFADQHANPQLAARQYIRQLTQPGWGGLFVEGSCWSSEVMPAPRLAPAPLPAEHTVEICRELGLSISDIARYREAGVLGTHDESRLAAGVTGGLT